MSDPDGPDGASRERSEDVDDDARTESIRLVTTTANTPSPGVGRHAATDAGADAGDDRGSLSIADVVVEKVATAAAGEVEGVGGAARRVLGVPTGRDSGDGSPQVSARVAGSVAALDVRLTVSYPASVRQVTEAAREHIADRVRALTELEVSRVDIDVAALTTSGASRRESNKRVIE